MNLKVLSFAGSTLFLLCPRGSQCTPSVWEFQGSSTKTPISLDLMLCLPNLFNCKIAMLTNARVCAQSLSHVWLFCDRMDISPPAPLSIEFSRQEYWSGLPFPPPGDLPNPGVEPMSLMSPALAGRFLTTLAPPANILEYLLYDRHCLAWDWNSEFWWNLDPGGRDRK